MATVERYGPENPLIKVSREELLEWLRGKADFLGFADRETCAVQCVFENSEGVMSTFDVPELTFMVSNIPNSRSVESKEGQSDV